MTFPIQQRVISHEIIAQVKRLHKDGCTQASIAAIAGITKRYVEMIICDDWMPKYLEKKPEKPKRMEAEKVKRKQLRESLRKEYSKVREEDRIRIRGALHTARWNYF